MVRAGRDHGNQYFRIAETVETTASSQQRQLASLASMVVAFEHPKEGSCK
jgi:hypothetical protein